MSASTQRAKAAGLTDIPSPPTLELLETYLGAVSGAIRQVMDEHNVPDKDRQSHAAQVSLEAFRTVIAMAFIGDNPDPRVLFLNEQAMREAVQSLNTSIDELVAMANEKTATIH